MNVQETLIQDRLSKHITARASGTVVAEVPIQIDGKADHLCVGAIRVRKGEHGLHRRCILHAQRPLRYRVLVHKQ